MRPITGAKFKIDKNVFQVTNYWFNLGQPSKVDILNVETGEQTTRDFYNFMQVVDQLNWIKI